MITNEPASSSSSIGCVSSSGGPAGVVFRAAPPMAVVRQIFRGLTLYRSLFHEALRGLPVHGRVLDLGGKSTDSSYRGLLKLDPQAELVVTDLNARPGVVALDVQRPFPFENDSFDFVLAFNLFEHVFHYEVAPAEIHRVLRPGGRLVMCVPFLHEYHADPQDYFRFTAPALRRIWEGSGLRCVLVQALGEGLLTYALTKIAGLVMPGPLKGPVSAALYLLSFPLDRIVGLRPPLDGLVVPARFPLGYYAIFEKPP